jgi:hypothetical protein
VNKNVEIEHTFLKTQIHNIGSVVLICDHCKLKINASDKHLLNCKDCHILVHLKCSKNAKKNCKPGSIEDESMSVSSNASNSPSKRPQSMNATDDANLVNMSSAISDIVIIESDLDQVVESSDERISAIREDEEVSKTEAGLNLNNVNANFLNTGSTRQFRQRDQKPSKKSNQICLQRLSQRVKKTSGYFWSGHMVYYTREMPKVCIRFVSFQTFLAMPISFCYLFITF